VNRRGRHTLPVRWELTALAVPPVHVGEQRASLRADAVTVTASSTPTQFALGSKLDRYELVCPIAEGGMASVWVARLRGKHGFEKLLAIKTILPRFAGDERFREMFLDEARIASRIEHPNVIQIFDLGEEHEVLYLAMEYVDGDSLSKLNRSCQKKGITIPTGVVLRVLADACAGLHEAHELKDAAGQPLGIVHRDISPHNILISTKGIVKLIDFGIAKFESGDAGDTESGVLKGKIQYMAPEQALGRAVDRRADVWAVGAILYHLLTGRAPYDGDNQLATLHLLGAGLPPPPLAPEVHPALAAVVRKALVHEPSKRYASANELREAIERAMVVAQLTTTSADVSAFSTKHLAERAQKRRDTIAQALAAVTDHNRLQAVRAAGALAAANPAPLVSDAPGATSYATLGSAALDASRSLAGATRVPRSTLTAVAFVFGFAVVMGASITVLRPKKEADAAPAAAARAPIESTTTMTSWTSLPPAAPAPSSSSPSSPSALSSALPRAESAAAMASGSPPSPEKHVGLKK
jgi:serine/threonine protein kinase